MTDRPEGQGETPEPSSLDLPPAPAPQEPPAPTPPPNAPPAAWAEPPAQVPPLGAGGYAPPPPPVGAPRPVYSSTAPLDPQQERTWAMVAHLSALAALVIGMNFLGPLLVYLAYKDRSEFVREHAAESLNFQITVMIGGLVSAILVIIVIGILMFLVLLVAWLILTVLAGVAANNGEHYRYPFNLRLIR